MLSKTTLERVFVNTQCQLIHNVTVFNSMTENDYDNKNNYGNVIDNDDGDPDDNDG